MRTIPIAGSRIPPVFAGASRCAPPHLLTVVSTGWEGPGLIQSAISGSTYLDLSYWDLHGLLLIPTAWLLTAGKPQLLNEEDSNQDELTRKASFSFIAFILTIAVAQAFVWDSVGAQIGIWEFNPQKSTGLGESTLLPLEEIAWLFHHVVKAALWQLKMSEWPLTAAPDGPPAPLGRGVRSSGNALLFAVWIAGAAALLGDVDSVKCVGLVAAFFAPIFAIIFNLGSRYSRSHWRLFVSGWLPPGAWTVAIDCVGQQQQVWKFPSRYLTGINTLPDGLLKLDIAAVYLVSTFAVTATGAIILAACEEFAAQRQAAARGLPASAPESAAAATGAFAVVAPATTPTGGAAALTAPAMEDNATLWDLGLFILHGVAPLLAERLAQVVPPSIQGWRVASSDQRGSKQATT
eukprot:CAMPEP_0115863574 /NCGR_PEP_ID=MMETSP0287-20121206/18758_1 /TAXON_ID=412157 /ORGANISM="Chrysochromulina rotalis, Strain UIO044" /LENGTH=405 /DNA_ID=CAMNT_0003318023 /DNA_START=1 /DNA_END=1218 /DNA_ORIENTATION=+